MPAEHSSLKSLADKLLHSTQASFLYHTPGGSQKTHSTSLSSCVSGALVLTEGSKFGLLTSPCGDCAPQAVQGGWGQTCLSSLWVGHKIVYTCFSTASYLNHIGYWAVESFIPFFFFFFPNKEAEVYRGSNLPNIFWLEALLCLLSQHLFFFKALFYSWGVRPFLERNWLREEREKTIWRDEYLRVILSVYPLFHSNHA